MRSHLAMGRKSSLLTGLGLAVVLVAAGALTPANAAEPSEPDLVSIVGSANPTSLENIADVETAEVGTSAIEADVAGAGITLPVNPADGVTIETSTETIQIGLPFADEAGDVAAVQPGAISYDNKNGSVTVPFLKSDGSLQVHTIIEEATAPTEYSYVVSIPEGGSLTPISDGAVAVLGTDGNPAALVPAPWAKDANGVDVPTHYEIDGDVLTQIIDHTAAGIAYPVVADPQFVWHGVLPSVKLTRGETAALRGIGAGAAGPNKACAAYVSAAGVAGAVLCGANIVSIMYNATRIYADGACAQLLIGPGVIGTISYRGGYCK
jgi:hypothetical protein